MKIPEAARMVTNESVPPATLQAGAGTTSPSALTTAVAEAAPVPVPTVPLDFSSSGTEPVISLGAEVNTPLSGDPIFQASVLNRREAEISFTQLAGIRAAGKGELLLDLGLPAGPVPADFSSVIENADGGCSFVGKVRGALLSRVLITQQDSALVGDISLSPAQEFIIMPGLPGAPHELRQVDRGVLPVCNEALEAQVAADEVPEEPLTEGDPLPEEGSPPSCGCTPPPAGVTIIDVMIVYTPECAARMGSVSGLIAVMNHATADANLCFSASGISCALRLVHHQQVSFTSAKMSQDILKLQKATDGVMDEVPILRDQYAADVVSLWHNYVNDSAGVAMLCRSGAMAKTSAYNVVDVDYVLSARSWVHEVGHNMGMNHDPENTNTGQVGVTASAYGHRFTGVGTGQVYTTIMAYPPGQRVPYFSNPDVFFDGTPTGTADANNAGAGGISKDWLAAARVPVALAITQQPVASTVNSGDTVTLSVVATGTPPAYQWLSGPDADHLTPITGATGSSIDVSPAVTTVYRVILQNGAGTVCSSAVLIKVNQDLDSDKDGIPDTVENANARNGGDSDGDGVPDWLDLDSDNDGIPDLAESGQTTGTDADHNGRLDGPVGTDGIPDCVQALPNGGTVNYSVTDSDGDNRPDYVDLDSDNDSISDLVESGFTGLTDADHNGVADGLPSASGLMPGANIASAAVNSDNDSLPDFRDPDSDGDGLSDIADNGYSGLDNDGNGRIDNSSDVDSDGIPDVLDTNGNGFGGFPLSGYAAWAILNPVDTDGDVFPLDQEYALGGLPLLGDHRVFPTQRRQGLVVSKRGSPADGVNVSFVRPAGRFDVTYTLYGSASLDPATVNWQPVAGSPVITANGDGTDTFTWENAGSLSPLTQAKGFVRLKVASPGNPSGSYTLVQGWSAISIEGSSQSYGVNFTSPPCFTGVIGAASGNSLSIPASSSGQNPSSYLTDTGGAWYVEFTDGPAEGHRLDISGGSADTLNLDLASANNTLNALAPELAGSHFVIRKHYTLKGLFPNSEWKASSSSGSADQIQFRNGNGYDVAFNFPGGVWRDASTLADLNGKVIPPGLGVLVHHAKSTAVNLLLQLGEVRYNDFALPVGNGSFLVAQGYPLNASPNGLLMSTSNGFTGSFTVGEASQIQIWNGDTTANATGYSVSMLQSTSVWLQTSTSPATTVSDVPLFNADRAGIVLTRQANPGWVHPMNWSPAPWVQP